MIGYQDIAVIEAAQEIAHFLMWYFDHQNAAMHDAKHLIGHPQTEVYQLEAVLLNEQRHGFSIRFNYYSQLYEGFLPAAVKMSPAKLWKAWLTEKEIPNIIRAGR